MSRGLPAAGHLRARRWDVLVLGGALPGLVAAVRLARGGQRVLVAEEEAAARTPDLLREPFLLPGRFGEGLVDATLRALGVPLIERQAREADELALQVLLPDARVEIGAPALTAEELVAWGLAKPDEARALVEGLAAAARAEAEALLDGDLVRCGALRSLARAGRGAPTTPGSRGLPAPLAEARGDLARLFELLTHALAPLASAAPSPEQRARLLGSVLSGGGPFARAGEGLRSVLRRRLAALHVEFRTLGCPFQLVELGDDPGIARLGPDDVWCGRALVLNAPGPRLAAALEGWGQEAPRLLAGSATTARRFAVHVRTLREALPEPLARRAILAARDGGEPVQLAVHPSSRGGRFAELVLASVAAPGASPEAQTERLLAELAHWAPFAEGRARLAPATPRPLWDDEDALADPPRGAGWPSPVELRAAGRRPVFRLPRDEVAGLGVEGELLLGWRAGDAIRAELV